MTIAAAVAILPPVRALRIGRGIEPVQSGMATRFLRPLPLHLQLLRCLTRASDWPSWEESYLKDSCPSTWTGAPCTALHCTALHCLHTHYLPNPLSLTHSFWCLLSPSIPDSFLLMPTLTLFACGLTWALRALSYTRLRFVTTPWLVPFP